MENQRQKGQSRDEYSQTIAQKQFCWITLDLIQCLICCALLLFEVVLIFTEWHYVFFFKTVWIPVHKPHKQTNGNDGGNAPTSSILASRKAGRKLSGRHYFIMHPWFSCDSSQPIFTSFKRDSCRAVPTSQHCSLIISNISFNDAQIEKFWCSP